LEKERDGGERPKKRERGEKEKEKTNWGTTRVSSDEQQAISGVPKDRGVWTRAEGREEKGETLPTTELGRGRTIVGKI